MYMLEYLTKQIYISEEFFKTRCVMEWIHASIDCDSSDIST